MAKFKVIKPCAGYSKGDIAVMSENDAAKYGTEYLKEVSDDNTEKQNDETADGNNKNAETNKENENNVDASNNSSNTGDAGNANTDEPNLEEMSYQDLKTLAASKGLEFAHNISRVNLIELIKQ